MTVSKGSKLEVNSSVMKERYNKFLMFFKNSELKKGHSCVKMCDGYFQF